MRLLRAWLTLSRPSSTASSRIWPLRGEGSGRRGPGATCGPDRGRTRRAVAPDFMPGRTLLPVWIVTTPRHTLSPGAPPALRLPRPPDLRSRSVRGDAAAFAALYERHHQEL